MSAAVVVETGDGAGYTIDDAIPSCPLWMAASSLAYLLFFLSLKLLLRPQLPSEQNDNGVAFDRAGSFRARLSAAICAGIAAHTSRAAMIIID